MFYVVNRCGFVGLAVVVRGRLRDARQSDGRAGGGRGLWSGPSAAKGFDRCCLNSWSQLTGGNAYRTGEALGVEGQDEVGTALFTTLLSLLRLDVEMLWLARCLDARLATDMRNVRSLLLKYR